jgi:hypothetical protein
VIEPDTQVALPEAWRSSIQSISGFLGVIDRGTWTPFATPVTVEADAAECCFSFQAPCPWFWDATSSTGYTYGQRLDDTQECIMSDRGVLDSGTAPSGTFSGGHRGSGATCGVGSQTVVAFNIYNDPGFFVVIPVV